jgi:hypothetical protein
MNLKTLYQQLSTTDEGFYDAQYAFERGYEAGQAAMRPHLDQLARQLDVSPVGDLTAEIEGITIGAVQAQIG